jgi:uncharacterized protein YceK
MIGIDPHQKSRMQKAVYFYLYFIQGDCSMLRLANSISLVGLMVGAMALSGCATVDSVNKAQAAADHAQATADAAGTAAQSAAAAAQRAQSSADAAGSAAQSAGAAAQRAQGTADGAQGAAAAAQTTADSAKKLAIDADNDAKQALSRIHKHKVAHHKAAAAPTK